MGVRNKQTNKQASNKQNKEWTEIISSGLVSNQNVQIDERFIKK